MWGSFRAFTDPLPEALLLIRLEDGIVQDANRAAASILEIARENLTGLDLLEVNGSEEFRKFLRIISLSRTPVPGTLQVPREFGRTARYRVDGSAVPGLAMHCALLRIRERDVAHADFTILTDKISDLTREVIERRRLEQLQSLLIAELNHRVKNTLTTVQALAQQSFRDVPGSLAATRVFEERLFTLARAHDLLASNAWKGADVRAIVEETLTPFAASSGCKFDVSGPSIQLPPKLTVAIAMAVHELSTNATKFGALSHAEGRVSLSWTTNPLDIGRELILTWNERGGPPVSAPVKQGFGTRLIQRGLFSETAGEAALRFDPEGVTCIIKLRISDEETAQIGGLVTPHH